MNGKEIQARVTDHAALLLQYQERTRRMFVLIMSIIVIGV